MNSQVNLEVDQEDLVDQYNREVYHNSQGVHHREQVRVEQVHNLVRREEEVKHHLQLAKDNDISIYIGNFYINFFYFLIIHV